MKERLPRSWIATASTLGGIGIDASTASLPGDGLSWHSLSFHPEGSLFATVSPFDSTSLETFALSECF